MSIIRAAASLDIRGFVGGLQTMVSQTNATVNSIQTRLQTLEQTGNRAFATMAAQSKATSQGIAADFSVLSDAEKRLLSIQTAFNGLFRAGTQLASVGRTLAVMGVAINGLGVAAIKAAQDTEFYIATATSAIHVANRFGGAVESLSAAQAKNKDIAVAMRESVEGIAASVGLVKPQEIAEGFNVWARAMGDVIDSADKAKALAPTILIATQAAAMSGESLETVLTGVSGLLSQMMLGAEQAPGVIAAISNAAAISQASMGDLIESFKFIGPMAASVGINIAELTSIVVKLADVGIRGSSAGRGLQQVITALVNPSKEAEDALQLLFDTTGHGGQKWRDIIYPGGQFIGIMDKITEGAGIQKGVISVLADATENMSQAEKAWYLAQLGPANAIRQLIPLAEAENKRRRDRNQLLEQQAALQARVSAGDQTAISDLKKVTDSLATIEQKDPANVLKFLQDGVGQLQLFDESWQIVANTIRNQMGVELNKLQLGFSQLGDAAAGALIPLLRQVNDVVAVIRNWAKNHAELFDVLVKTVGILGAVLVSMGAFNIIAGQLIQFYTIIHSTLAAMGPFVAVLTNVGVLFSGLGLIVLGVVAALIQLSRFGGENWTNFVGAVRQAGKDVIEAFMQIVTSFAEMINFIRKGDIESAMEAFKNIIVTAVSVVALNVPKIIGLMLKGVIDLINGATGGMASLFYIWGANLISQLAAGMLEATKYVARVIGVIVGLISMVFKGYSPPRDGPLKDIKLWGKNLGKTLAEGFGSAEDEVIDAVDAISRKISDRLEGHSPPKAGKLKDIDEWGKNVGSAYIKGFSKAEDHADEAADRIGQTLARKLEGHSPTKEGPLSTIDEWGVGPAQAYTDTVEHVLVAGMDDAAQKAGDALERGLSARIPEGIDRAAPKAYEAGRTFMDGLFNSFRKADFGTLDEVMNVVAKTLEDGMTRALSGLDMTKDENKLKKIDLANALFGNTQEARALVAQTIRNMNASVDSLFENFQGLDTVKQSLDAFRAAVHDSMDTSPVEKLAALVGNSTIADDLRNMVSALADVDAVQKFKDEIDDIILKSQDIRNQHQEIIDNLKEEVAQARRAKEPYEDIIQEIRGTIQGLQDTKQANEDAFEPTKTALERIKDIRQGVQDTITDLRLQIADQKDLLDPIEQQLDVINRTKEGIESQVKAIKERYDLERQADRDRVTQLDLTLDKTRLLNDQFNLAAEKAIDQAKRSGTPLAVINNQLKQLELAKQRQKFEEQTLDIQKRQEQIASTERETQRTSNEQAELSVLDQRKKLADGEELRLKTERDNIQKRIDGYEQQIRLQEHDDRTNEREQNRLERLERIFNKEQEATDRRIEQERRREANNQKEIDLIERRAQLFERNDIRPLEDALRAEDINLRVLNNRKSVIEQELSAAKERLDIQKAITEEHQKATAEALRAAQEIASASKGGKDAEGSPFAGTIPGIPKDLGLGDLSKQVEEFQKNLQKTIEGLFKDLKIDTTALETEKNRINGLLAYFFDNIQAEFNIGRTTAQVELSGWAADISLSLRLLTTALRKFGEGDLKDGLRTLELAFLVVANPIRDAAGKLFDQLGTTVQEKITEFIQGSNLSGTQKMNILQLIFSTGTDDSKWIGDIVNGAKKTLGDIKTNIEGLLNGEITFAQLGENIKKGILAAFDYVSNTIGGDIANRGLIVKSILGEAFGPDSAGPLNAFGNIFKTIGDTIKNFGSAFGEILPPLVSIVVTFGQALGFTFLEIFRQVGALLAEHGPALREALTNINEVLKVLLPILGMFATAFVVGFVQGIIHIIEGIGNLIKGIGMMKDVLVDLFSGKGFDAKKFFSGFGTAISGVLEGILGFLEIGFVGRFLGIFKAVPNQLTATISPIGKVLQNLPKTILDGFGNALRGLGDGIINIIVGIWARLAGTTSAAIQQEFKVMVGIFGLGFELLGTAVNGALPRLIRPFADLAGGIVALIANMAGRIVALFLEFPGEIIAGIAIFVHSIIEFFQHLFDILVGHSIVPEMIQGIIDAFLSLPGAIIATVQKFVSDIGDAFDELGTNVHGAIDDLVKDAGNLFDSFGTNIHEAFESVIRASVSFFTTEAPKIGEELLNGVKSGAESIWNSTVKPFIDGLFGAGSADSILSTILSKNPISLLVDVGSDILKGLWNGINDWWQSNLGPWFDNLGTTIHNEISKQADFARLLWDIGTKTLQGFWDGVIEKWEAVKSWFAGIGPTIASWFNMTGVLDSIKQAGANLIGALQQGIQEAWNKLPEGIRNLLGGGTVTTTTNVTQTPTGVTTSVSGTTTPSTDNPWLTQDRPHAAGGVLNEPIVGMGLQSGARYTFAEGGSPELIFNRLSAERLDNFVTAALQNINALSTLTQGPAPAQVGIAPTITITQQHSHYHVGMLIADKGGMKMLADQIRPFQEAEKARRL